MDKIEIGEYVRTKNNGIKRIDTIFENKTVNKYGYECGSDWDGEWYSYIKTTDIVKHSKNLVDLVGVRDVIKVRNLKGDIFDFILEIFDDKTMIDFKLAIDSKEIKLLSILTKQQYEQNCYVIEKE